MIARLREWQLKFDAADQLAAERQAEIEQINARLQTTEEQTTAAQQLAAEQQARGDRIRSIAALVLSSLISLPLRLKQDHTRRHGRIERFHFT